MLTSDSPSLNSSIVGLYKNLTQYMGHPVCSFSRVSPQIRLEKFASCAIITTLSLLTRLVDPGFLVQAGFSKGWDPG